MWGRGRRKDREGEAPLRDLVTLKEAERRAGAEGGATRATEGWGGEGRPRDGDRQRALGCKQRRKQAGRLGAVRALAHLRQVPPPLAHLPPLGVSQCAFLFPKEPLGSTWMDGLSITAKNEGQPFFPLQK